MENESTNTVPSTTGASLSGIETMGIGLGAHGLLQLGKKLMGSEGRIHIMITNRMTKDIFIHLYGGNDSEQQETLGAGVTRIFSKKPKDSPIRKTTAYECEFWVKNTHASIFVYGGKAPRKEDNRYEVREDGFYLVDQIGQYLLHKW